MRDKVVTNLIDFNRNWIQHYEYLSDRYLFESITAIQILKILF